VVACARGSEQQSSPAVAAKARPEPNTLSFEFRTRDGCRLGIARYPDFAYNAQGGRGVGAGRGAKSGEDGTVLVNFDVATLYIPSMSGATTRFLGLPLPPFLKIDILPEALGGTIDRATGQVTVRLLRPAVLAYLHPRKSSFHLLYYSLVYFLFFILLSKEQWKIN
jgi:hypothetical protein